MVCPRCGHGCYALVFRDGWECRRCSGCKYRSMYRRSLMQRRLIPGDFIRKLSETIPEGSSALFVLFKSVTEDKVLPEIQPYKPRILKTSLSNEAEAKLRAALSRVA